ncbi:MAG TPA: protoheme IX farnesyltransferase, partial [Flavobacteriales bacterium]|nr:protoheme IX farnesyltransferase [Flavobacteriales bacterium]
KAGFKMLPLNEGRGRRNAWLILLFTMFMLPVSLLPWAFEMTHGLITIPVASIATLIFIVPAFKLFRTNDMKEATKLMFVSFLYLPIVQIAYILDKI